MQLILSKPIDGYIKDNGAKTLIIEEGIEIINEDVIFDCPLLENIIIPTSLKQIHGNSFSLCPNLIQFVISNNHDFFCVIDQTLFSKDGKTLIKYLEKDNYAGYQIPKMVENIHRGAFKNTKALTEIYFEGTIKEIPPYCFENTNIESIILPEGLEKIGHHAFYNASIKELVIPNSVKIISNYAFEKCSQIQKVSMPKILSYFGKGIFKDCLLLKGVKLSSGIEILNETFINCKSLKQVYLPETIKKIDDAFSVNVKTTLYGKYIPTLSLKYSKDLYEEEKIYKPNIIKTTFDDYKNAQINDVVTFGTWMNRAENDYKEPLEWIVIDRKEHQLLLLSKYALCDMTFSSDACNDWNESTINEYLNTTFLKETFHPIEVKAIVEQNRCSYDFAERKPYEHYRSKVFLLNFDEASSLNRDNCIAQCTDALYVYSNKDVYTSWWLSSIDDRKFDYVSNKGEFLTDICTNIHSIRPAIWIDIHHLNCQTNEQYIKQWFMKNNPYMSLRKDKDSFLEKLCHYVILFEKLDGLNNDDYMIKDKQNIKLISGYPYQSNRKEWILKMINYLYAYLDEQYMSNDTIYKTLYKYDYIEGIITDKICHDNFQNWYNFHIRHYGNEKFNRIVYRLNNNVYYADQYLTQEEIDIILKFKPSDQRLFDIDHNEDGTFNCW